MIWEHPNQYGMYGLQHPCDLLFHYAQETSVPLQKSARSLHHEHYTARGR